MQILAHRRRARDSHPQRIKLIRDLGHLRNQQIDGRHGKEESNAVFLVVLEELGEIELGHPVGWTAHVERIHKVALHTCDVGDGKMGERLVLEVELLLDGVAAQNRLSDHIHVREGHALGKTSRARGVDEAERRVLKHLLVGDLLPAEFLVGEDILAVACPSQSHVLDVDHEDVLGWDTRLLCSRKSDFPCLLAADDQFGGSELDESFQLFHCRTGSYT